MGPSQASAISGPSSETVGSLDHVSRSAEPLSHEQIVPKTRSLGPYGAGETKNISSISCRRRMDSPSRSSFSSSLNQSTPARSYFHRAFDSHCRSLSNGRRNRRSHLVAPIHVAQNATQDVRDDTAELASWALSDITTSRYRTSPNKGRASPTQSNNRLEERSDFKNTGHQVFEGAPRPDIIVEVSESSSPRHSNPSPKSPGASALTQMLREGPPREGSAIDDLTDDEASSNAEILPVTVDQGIISQPRERTALLLKKAAYDIPTYGSLQDVESQTLMSSGHVSGLKAAAASAKSDAARIFRRVGNPKSWNKQATWYSAIYQPPRYIPPVLLGLLLNVLDALSYGTECPFSKHFIHSDT